MKTEASTLKRSKLFIAIMIFMLVIAKNKTYAQCTAMFSAADSAGSTYFTNFSTGSGLTSTWDFGDGTTFSTTGNAVYTYSAAGAYLVCLTVTNALGTCTSSYCDSVFVPYGSSGMCSGSVNSGFVAGDSACYGYFYNTPSGGGVGQVYHWDYGDGTTGSAVGTNIHLYPGNGTYYVCLTVYDAIDSCQYCNFVTINSCSSSGCSASFNSVDSSGYVFFSNQSTGIGSGVTCTWNFGDGSSGTSSGDIVHNYTTSGVYYVCMTMSNFMGTCNDTFCDSVYVNINPTSSGMCLGVVNPYFTSTDSSMYGLFSNTPSGSGQVYYWDFGDGSNSSSIGSVSHLYPTPGVYNVCLTVYETGGSYDSCQFCSYVTIGSIATSPCDANFTLIQDSTNLFNYFAYMFNTSTSPTMNYLWDFGDGTSSTLQYPTHTYPSSGPYYICLTITDSSPMLGCSDTHCDSIAAGHSSTPITLNVVNTTGILEGINPIGSLENYPNPFSNNTTITYTLSKEGNVELIVMDLLGNKVASIESGNKGSGTHSTIFNSNEISGGMYLLQLKINNNISTKKIIISK